jgi:hypothetical protein
VIVLYRLSTFFFILNESHLKEAVLGGADFEDRKARVNRKPAGLLYLNLIQENVWPEEYDVAVRLFDDMRRLDTKKTAEGTAESLDTFCEDQKQRKAANPSRSCRWQGSTCSRTGQKYSHSRRTPEPGASQTSSITPASL